MKTSICALLLPHACNAAYGAHRGENLMAGEVTRDWKWISGMI